MSLIDTTYFVGDLHIPQLDIDAVAARLQWYINRHEFELLREVLGIGLYREFVTALGQNATTGIYANVTNGIANEGVDPLYAHLLNGVEYTGKDNYLHEWIGFVSPSVDGYPIKRSPIANYVYYWYLRDSVTKATDAGEIFPMVENGRNVTSGAKASRAWNEMVRWIRELIYYMETFILDTEYADWWPDSRERLWRKFKPINTFSI